MAIMLVGAQALWGTAVKHHGIMHGTNMRIIQNIITSPLIWMGGLLYVFAIVVYFFLLSDNKFYVVQIAMTTTAIIFSTLLAVLFFHEKLSYINVMGIFLVLIGLSFVISR